LNQGTFGSLNIDYVIIPGEYSINRIDDLKKIIPEEEFAGNFDIHSVVGKYQVSLRT